MFKRQIYNLLSVSQNCEISLNNEKKLLQWILLKLNSFSFSKPKVVRSFLLSLTFSKFWKQIFFNFRHKHFKI